VLHRKTHIHTRDGVALANVALPALHNAVRSAAGCIVPLSERVALCAWGIPGIAQCQSFRCGLRRTTSVGWELGTACRVPEELIGLHIRLAALRQPADLAVGDAHGIACLVDRFDIGIV